MKQNSKLAPRERKRNTIVSLKKYRKKEKKNTNTYLSVVFDSFSWFRSSLIGAAVCVLIVGISASDVVVVVVVVVVAAAAAAAAAATAAAATAAAATAAAAAARFLHFFVLLSSPRSRSQCCSVLLRKVKRTERELVN